MRNPQVKVCKHTSITITLWEVLKVFVCNKIHEVLYILMYRLTMVTKSLTHFSVKVAPHIYLRITMTSKSGKHLHATYGAMNSCFDHIRSHQQCTP